MQKDKRNSWTSENNDWKWVANKIVIEKVLSLRKQFHSILDSFNLISTVTTMIIIIIIIVQKFVRFVENGEKEERNFVRLALYMYSRNIPSLVRLAKKLFLENLSSINSDTRFIFHFSLHYHIHTTKSKSS